MVTGFPWESAFLELTYLFLNKFPYGNEKLSYVNLEGVTCHPLQPARSAESPEKPLSTAYGARTKVCQTTQQSRIDRLARGPKLRFRAFW